MALPIAPKPTSLSLNLAPMVDVMMVLIIFFMLATDLVRSETVQVELPYAAASKEIAGPAELGNRVVVNVRAVPFGTPDEAEYLIGDKVVTLAMVLDRLEREARRDPNVRCVVRAERELTFRHVQAVLLACARAKVSNIAFSTIKGTEPQESPS